MCDLSVLVRCLRDALFFARVFFEVDLGFLFWAGGVDMVGRGRTCCEGVKGLIVGGMELGVGGEGENWVMGSDCCGGGFGGMWLWCLLGFSDGVCVIGGMGWKKAWMFLFDMFGGGDVLRG